MLSSLEIAQNAKLKPIKDVAKRLGLKESDLEAFGNFKAKVSHNLLKKWSKRKDGKLILVTAITPTSAGEGKTTTTISLAQGLAKLKKKSMVCLRQPSMGPVFGIKGGAAGGGFSQVLPMEDINLGLNGDIDAVTNANNLLAAMVDNHIFQGNALKIDLNKVVWTRCLDMNDRALRKISIGLTDSEKNSSRSDSFKISVASEVMAVLCLSKDLNDLKERLGKIIAAYSIDGKPVTCRDLKCDGALAVILRKAINPNLVQSIEGVPAFVHGGPFANIAHGCNSVIATKMALKLADFVVTEAGFGADLGMEKFFDIKCRIAGLKPNAIVLVATIRALRMHGNSSDYSKPDIGALEKGIENLLKQVENAKAFGITPIVSINHFSSDSIEEIEFVKQKCSESGVKSVLCRGFAEGGKGAVDLAKEVLKSAGQKNDFNFLYGLNLPLKKKIEAIALKMYGANGVEFSEKAEKEISFIESNGFSNLPVCMAKTQLSLSDNPKLLGRPENFKIKINGVGVSAGAGFVVAFAGNIMTMPGLPKNPSAEKIGIDADGKISGLF